MFSRFPAPTADNLENPTTSRTASRKTVGARTRTRTQPFRKRRHYDTAGRRHTAGLRDAAPYRRLIAADSPTAASTPAYP
jgi:hypothetical protein